MMNHIPAGAEELSSRERFAFTESPAGGEVVPEAEAISRNWYYVAHPTTSPVDEISSSPEVRQLWEEGRGHIVRHVVQVLPLNDTVAEWKNKKTKYSIRSSNELKKKSTFMLFSLSQWNITISNYTWLLKSFCSQFNYHESIPNFHLLFSLAFVTYASCCLLHLDAFKTILTPEILLCKVIINIYRKVLEIFIIEFKLSWYESCI